MVLRYPFTDALFLFILVAAVVFSGFVAEAQGLVFGVESEAFVGELVRIVVPGVEAGSSYSLAISGASLVAFNGAEVSSFDGSIAFTAVSSEAVFYVYYGSPGSYLVELYSGPEVLASGEVLVRPFADRGVPGVGVDSGEELMVALAAAAGLGEVAGFTVWEALQPGSGGVAAVYLVSDVVLQEGGVVGLSYAELASRGVSSILVRGAYGGVAGAVASLTLDSSSLGFSVAPGDSTVVVSLEDLALEALNGGRVYYEPGGLEGLGSVLAFRNVEISASGLEVSIFLTPTSEPPPSLDSLGWLVFDNTSGNVSVRISSYLVTRLAVSLVGLEAVDSPRLSIELDATRTVMPAGVVVRGENTLASLELRGIVALLPTSGTVLRAGELRLVVDPNTTTVIEDKRLPAVGITAYESQSILFGGGLPEGFTPPRIIAGVIEGGLPSPVSTREELDSVRGSLVLAYVSVSADEVVLGRASLGERLQFESWMPAYLRIESASIYAGLFEAGALVSTTIQGSNAGETIIVASTVVISGSDISLDGVFIESWSLVIQSASPYSEAVALVEDTALEAQSMALTSLGRLFSVEVSISSITSEGLEFNGLVDVLVSSSILDASEIVANRSPLGSGGQASLEMYGVEMPGFTRVSEVNSIFSLEGSAILQPGSAIVFVGVSLSSLTLEAQSGVYVELVDTSGFLEILLRGGATATLKASSPSAYVLARIQEGGSSLVLAGGSTLSGLELKAQGGSLVLWVEGSSTLEGGLAATVSEAPGSAVVIAGYGSGESSLTVGWFDAGLEAREFGEDALMDAGGFIAVSGVEIVSSGKARVGYAQATFYAGSLWIYNSRPYGVSIVGSTIRSGEGVEVGGVYETVIRNSSLESQGDVVVRGLNAVITGSVIRAAGALVVEPIVLSEQSSYAIYNSIVEAGMAEFRPASSPMRVEITGSEFKSSYTRVYDGVVVSLRESTAYADVFEVGAQGLLDTGSAALEMSGVAFPLGATAIGSPDGESALVVSSGSAAFLDASMWFGEGGLAIGGVDGGDAMIALGGERAYIDLIGLAGCASVEVLAPAEEAYVGVSGGSCVSVTARGFDWLDIVLFRLDGGEVSLRVEDFSGALYTVNGRLDALLIEASESSSLEINGIDGAVLSVGSFEVVAGGKASINLINLVVEASGDIAIGSDGIPLNKLKISNSTLFAAGDAHLAANSLEVSSASISVGGGITLSVGYLEVRESMLDAGWLDIEGVDGLSGSGLSTAIIDGAEVRVDRLEAGGSTLLSVLVSESSLYSREGGIVVWVEGGVTIGVASSEIALEKIVSNGSTNDSPNSIAAFVAVESRLGGGLEVENGGGTLTVALYGGESQLGELALSTQEGGRTVVVIAGQGHSLAGCSIEGDSSVYLVNTGVDQALCPSAINIGLPEGAEVLVEEAVLGEGVATEVLDITVLQEGEALLAAYIVLATPGEGEINLVISTVGIAPYSTAISLGLALPDCGVAFLVSDAATGTPLAVLAPEEDCKGEMLFEVPRGVAVTASLAVEPLQQGEPGGVETTTETETVTETVTVVETTTLAQETVVVTETATVESTVTETVTQETTLVETATVTATETYTETVVVEGAGGLGGGALAAALVAFIVGAAAAYLASRRLGG
ncbi:MAG: hypothetical protein F7B20_00015 [Aeropyrum sp.]|nr:hypothetical protein [Aeropyrum sp.]